MKFFTGYYCPVSTEFAYQYPCPNGTFNNITGAQDSSLCQICPPGEYCPTPGLALPAGKCSGGWYCTSGSWSSQPAVLGNDTGSTCDCPAQSIGGKCQAGTFCPEGSSAPISCLGGHYCDVAGLNNVTGECLPGKYALIFFKILSVLNEYLKSIDCFSSDFITISSCDLLKQATTVMEEQF